MRIYKIILVIFMAIVTYSCKTMQEPVELDSNRASLRNQEIVGIKIDIAWNSKRKKTNNGTLCQNANSVCIKLSSTTTLTDDDESFALAEYDENYSLLNIAIPMFDENSQQNNFYDDVLCNGNLIIDDTTAIWEQDILSELAVNEPIKILPGEYQFHEDENDMSLKLEIPVFPANLESGIALFIVSSNYPVFEYDHFVLDSFYVGYLGESFDPVAIVEIDNGLSAFILHFPLELNDNTQNSYFNQIFADEYLSIPEGTKVDDLEYINLLGLDSFVRLTPGNYPIIFNNNEFTVTIPFSYSYR